MLTRRVSVIFVQALELRTRMLRIIRERVWRERQSRRVGRTAPCRRSTRVAPSEKIPADGLYEGESEMVLGNRQGHKGASTPNEPLRDRYLNQSQTIS